MMTDESEVAKPEINNTSMSSEQLPREQLIDTAIKFLNNPKVTQSPLSHKKAFLEKKGLTNAEIDLAISKAGIKEAVPINDNALSNFYSASIPNQFPLVPVSRWSKFREIWYATIIIGGTVYGAYILATKYIIPYIWGHPKKVDRVSRLEQQMNDFQSHLDQNMIQLQKSMEELQTSVRESCQKQEILNSQATVQPSKAFEDQVAEIRAEIKILKGLLLNRHQFPTVPSVSQGIPPWQLEKTEVNGTNEDDNSVPQENESEA